MTLDLFFSANMQPFAIALGVVVGMLVLELVLMLVGISILGGDGDVAIDAEPGLDVDVGLDAEAGFEVDVDGADPLAGESAGVSGVLSWLGLSDAPFAIWLAGFLTAFGLSGYALQGVLNAIVGAPLPALLASAVALPVGLAIAARFARLIGRLMPKLETTAISSRSYGGRRGIITVGTARRGNPAQARLTDGHGNIHYTMVEPMKDDDAFPQGTEIATIRLADGSLRAIRIDDA